MSCSCTAWPARGTRWARLPGTRELASEVGANRNTVAKVYGELARQGLIEIMPGRGAFVASRLNAADVGADPIGQVARLIEEAIDHARLFGLERQALEAVVREQISAAYDDGGTPRVAFVECNPLDAQQGARELGMHLGMAVQPLLVTELQPRQGMAPLELVLTSLFHLEELDRLLAGSDVPVAGVNTLPDPDALQALARLGPGTRVGIVVANEAAVDRFTGMVRTYCRAEIRSAVNPDATQLAALAKWAEVLVSSLSCAPQAHAAPSRAPVITLAFHVDPHSVQRLRVSRPVAFQAWRA